MKVKKGIAAVRGRKLHNTYLMIKLFTRVDEDEIGDGISQIQERRQWLTFPSGKFQGRRLLGRPKLRLGNNITIYRNPLTPNDLYMSRTAPLTCKRSILYIYSTNVGAEYFKHALYSPFFFSLQNAVCFIMVTCFVPVLFTFYMQGVLKLKKIIPAPKG